MPYYIGLDAKGHYYGTWEITADEAVRVGVTNARGGASSFFKANPGEDIFDALRRMTGWFGPNGENPFHRVTLEPGQYYPRMARPYDSHPDESPGHYPNLPTERESHALSQSQLSVLSGLLERICHTLHPAPGNLKAYGHDIRNLLILAATEVESQWRGILVANGVTPQHFKSSQFKTTHYVKLCAPMRLNEYAVELAEYPSLPPICPFASWDSSSATKSLPWYHAYNGTKHDREGQFADATLEHAISAICAAVVMLVSQYGSPSGLGQRTPLSQTFKLVGTPQWSAGDIYIHPYDRAGGWSPALYPF